mmetsp:Transcript_29168/g.64695  ORF Transcript_29168/g.64695 Transcript_29168/m.64695 type:complete len:303 (-) Transcript_29168:1432-2340(-)
MCEGMDEDVKQSSLAFTSTALFTQPNTVLEQVSKLQRLGRVEEDIVHLLYKRRYKFKVTSKGSILTAYLAFIKPRRRNSAVSSLNPSHYISIQLQSKRDENEFGWLKRAHEFNHCGELREKMMILGVQVDQTRKYLAISRLEVTLRRIKDIERKGCTCITHWVKIRRNNVGFSINFSIHFSGRRIARFLLPLHGHSNLGKYLKALKYDHLGRLVNKLVNDGRYEFACILRLKRIWNNIVIQNDNPFQRTKARHHSGIISIFIGAGTCSEPSRAFNTRAVRFDVQPVRSTVNRRRIPTCNASI